MFLAVFEGVSGVFRVLQTPCSKGFFPRYSSFPFPPEKPAFLNFNSTWKQYLDERSTVEATEIPIDLVNYLVDYSLVNAKR